MPYRTVDLLPGERLKAQALTAGEATTLLTGLSRLDTRTSVVNPLLTKGQVREILWNAVAGLPAEQVLRYEVARNVLRECLPMPEASI